jgi:hypothetical protein
MFATFPVGYGIVLGPAGERELEEVGRFQKGMASPIRGSRLPICPSGRSVAAYTGGARKRRGLPYVPTRPAQPDEPPMDPGGTIERRPPEQPRLHVAIRRQEFRDFRTLEELATRVERALLVEQEYRPPLPPEQSLFSDLAYRAPKGKQRSPATVATIGT